jgi:hypothetical protein
MERFTNLPIESYLAIAEAWECGDNHFGLRPRPKVKPLIDQQIESRFVASSSRGPSFL